MSDLRQNKDEEDMEQSEQKRGVTLKRGEADETKDKQGCAMHRSCAR